MHATQHPPAYIQLSPDGLISHLIFKDVCQIREVAGNIQTLIVFALDSIYREYGKKGEYIMFVYPASPNSVYVYPPSTRRRQQTIYPERLLSALLAENFVTRFETDLLTVPTLRTKTKCCLEIWLWRDSDGEGPRLFQYPRAELALSQRELEILLPNRGRAWSRVKHQSRKRHQSCKRHSIRTAVSKQAPRHTNPATANVTSVERRDTQMYQGG